MDLHDALHDLHRDFRGAATDRPAGPVVAAARRRRVTRRTGYGAVGAGAVAALVVGGLNLPTWRPPPPPPAVTSTTAPAPAPTPAPTRTTEPSATPSWTPTPAAPFQPDLSLCGTTVEVGAGDLQVFTHDAYRADRGALLTAPYEVDVDGTGGERVTVAPTVAVLVDASPDASQDRPVVLGVAAQALPGPAARVLDGWSDGPLSASLRLSLAIPFVMCPGVDGAGGPPPDGEYGVWTKVELAKDGTTHSGWGSAFNTVGPEPRPHDPRGHVNGGAMLDSSLDQSWCGEWTAQVGASPDQWAPTTGALTAQATGRLEDGTLIVGLGLRNQGPKLKSVEVRYPSFYVVTNDPFPWPDGRDSAPFAPPLVVHAGNIGTVAGAPSTTLGGPTPSWTPRTALGHGATLGLETSVGSVTCTQLFGTPWPSGSYTIYAFTEVGMPDGTASRVRAAPVTVTVP